MEARAPARPGQTAKKRQSPGSSESNCARQRPQHCGYFWSYGFVAARTDKGRQIRLLAGLGKYSRQCLAIEGSRCFTARDDMLSQQYLLAMCGTPQYVRSQNRAEFMAKELKTWLSQAAVCTLYIQKARTRENGKMKSSDSRMRGELLNREMFLGLAEGSFVLDLCRNKCNQQLPHGGLGWQTPAASAAQLEA